ncbi:DUF6314 family protein [Marinomonas sp. 5E14-1]|uniref:DUF6314 family protein n=1 Tax=Marinomonas sp. 5E14-1 TaxID=3153922 RepID=UPI003267C386
MHEIEAKEVLSYFVGSWKVQRAISGFGEITGQATFQVNDEHEQCLDFQEAMVLSNIQNKSQDQKPNAFRTYQYRMTDEGFDIFFSDGATKGDLFLSFAFTQASTLKSHHLCIKDHYDAKFEFLSDRQFQLSFSVVGPKKDYSILTTFTRLV